MDALDTLIPHIVNKRCGVAGLSDLSPGVFGHPMDWAASCRDHWNRFMALRLIRRFDAWPADVPRVAVLLSAPHRCYEIDPKLFPPTPSYEVKPYGRSRPYGSSLPSQYNASCAGRKSKSTYADRKPLSDFTVAVGQGLPMARRR